MFRPRVGNWYYRYRLPLPLELITSGIVIEYNEVNSGLFALQQHNRNVIYTKTPTLVRGLATVTSVEIPGTLWCADRLKIKRCRLRNEAYRINNRRGIICHARSRSVIAFLAKSRACIIRANEQRRDCTVWSLRKTIGNSSSSGGEGGKIQWCGTRVGK